MSGRGTRGRRLLVTLTLLLAGAGARHLIERHARRVSIAERRPVAALLPPPDGPDAEVLPIASSDNPEPVFSASAATSLSLDSNQPATAPSASDLSVQPLSATADAQSASSPLPAQPVAGGGDAQSTRQFPAELQDQAANNAAGWVYEIDPGCDRGGPVSPEHIIGAWRIDDQGSPTGEFVANSVHQPFEPKRRWRRRRKSDRAGREGS
jgi:hypothetical protein